MSEQPGSYRRSTTGMIAAMVVLVGLVLAFVVVREVIRTEPEASVPAVDYEKTVNYARQQTDFPIVAPSPLPEGWRATSVRFVPEPTRWHLGMLTDRDRYVGLEQAQASVRSMVERHVDREAVRGEPVEIDGARWQTWTDEAGDTALVRSRGDATTLVVGTVGRDELVAFVERLR